MVATALYVSGLIRASRPALLLAIQMLPAPAVMPPCVDLPARLG